MGSKGVASRIIFDRIFMDGARRRAFLFVFTAVLFLIFLSLFNSGQAATAYTISDDVTGGQCTLIGTWDAATKTCTLTTDVVATGTDGITIGSDGITLDGAGHTITGNNTYGPKGVRLTSRTGVTVRNLKVRQFAAGIYVYASSACNVSDNTVSGNDTGIEIASDEFLGIYSDNNVVSGNAVISNNFGIYLRAARSNTFSGNLISSNTSAGMRVEYYPYAGGSAYNVISGNVIDGGSSGITFAGSHYNLVKGNTISSNVTGIDFRSYTYRFPEYSSYNSTYNNNFINNATQSVVNGGTGNIFDKPLPDGGNYWSNWTAPDNNHDGLVDTPFVFSGGQDTRPWSNLTGWSQGNPALAPPTVSNVQPAGTINSASATISADYSDSTGIDPASVIMSMDGATLTDCTASATSVSCPVSGLTEGSHTILGLVADNAGNASPINGSFTYVFVQSDTTVPVVTYSNPRFVNPPDGGNGYPPIETTYATLQASFTDPGYSTGVDISSATASLNGGAPTSCTAAGSVSGTISCVVDGLSVGEYDVTISLTDNWGNTGTGTGHFHVGFPLQIRDDATGGDCLQIGTWDQATKTCTLTSDVGPYYHYASWYYYPVTAMSILSDGITINGNGHRINGTWSIDGWGEPAIRISGRDKIRIRNAVFSNWSIACENSSNIEITNNTFGGEGWVWVNLYNLNHVLIDSNAFTGATSGYANGLGANIMQNTLIENNSFTTATATGLVLDGTGNTVRRNTFSNNNTGLWLQGDGNSVYNNSFIANTGAQIQASGAIDFNQASPVGGNYFDNFDQVAEGCVDGNGDGFCDAPFVFSGSQDNLPWTVRDGWTTSPLFTVKPSLSISPSRVYWASYSDYLLNKLSADMAIANSGTGNAVNVRLTGSTNSGGVSLLTALPCNVGGNIASGSSAALTLTYNIPPGVTGWRSSFTASAENDFGNSYTYP
ncbi:MAG: NosD domain-containing protein [Thermoleophilia bacterium]|jgi:parallel beta-helix repeat protein